MAGIELILPDGKAISTEKGAAFRDVVRSVGEGLA
jgi:hypothetical protein